MKRLFGYTLLFIAVFALGVFVLNTNLRAPKSEARPLVIAHRGPVTATDPGSLNVILPAARPRSPGLPPRG